MRGATQDVTGPNPDPAGFGVYVHWPFCASKCPYCDFNSHVRHGGVDQDGFAAAYVAEIRQTAGLIGARSISSIFFGGGTPSLMEPRTLARILDEIGRVWTIEAGAEITLEANPSSVEAERFAGYRRAGINRVSLGVQALDDESLGKLGRLHSVDEALRAIAIAKRTFDRMSFDLIYARPGQSADAWRAELDRALELANGHLSAYQLTIEEGTPFAELHRTGRLRPPPSQLADDLFQLTQDMTAAAGLPAYEISNHAMPGQESRHNLLYWRYGEFAGIGAGAHGRLIIDGRRTGSSTERMPERWLERVRKHGHGRMELETLDRAEQADELLLMGLRLTEGIDPHRLSAIGGVALDPVTVQLLTEDGFLKTNAGTGRVAATHAGRFVLNELVLQLATTFVPAVTDISGASLPLRT
jgi:putative oxygen-independent coproporphyrinogen III oxidase